MQIDLVPTLIDMYRETFEGEVKPGWVWIVSGRPEESVLAGLATQTAAEAYAVPAPGRKSIAAHARHLQYTLELTLKRLHGENPHTDWPNSFQVAETSDEAWNTLQRGLRDAYSAVLAFFDLSRAKPVDEWPPIHVVGLAAMTAHNAYHLGAIRQLMLDGRR